MQKRGIETGGSYYEDSKMFHGALKEIMGTRFDILIIGRQDSTSREIWREVIFELRRLDQLFNRFDVTSETSRINREAVIAPAALDPEMWSILQNCRSYHRRTSGLFDITLDDFSKVQLAEKDQTIFFPEEDISLDFGGYAKGYALLKIKDIIQQGGVEHCFVDFGNSSIMGIGQHPYGDAWKVSFENPYRQNVILDEISLKDMSLSVSGNTPSYTGHIVRPDTREPVNGHKAISVVSEDPLEAEILSTVLMIATEAEKAKISKNFKTAHTAEYNL